jgi:hypothetical protein
MNSHQDTTSDQRIHDILRHFPKMLDRWRGGRAQLWTYRGFSHSSLTIRVTRTGILGNLEISISPRHICGPTQWENSNILIRRDPHEGFVVEDIEAQFRATGDAPEVKENVKPVAIGA